MSPQSIVLQAVRKILMPIFMVAVIFILILPVADLPVATSVPAYVWITLAAADAALIILLVRYRRSLRLSLAILAGMAAVLILAVTASQVLTSTPPIAGSNSIAVLEKVNLGGRDQWITIRGKDANKPVLLYLGIGGPGAGGFPATAMSLKPLEDHFVVVNWDQPGTGKSYDAAPIPTLTVEQFVSDAHQLTQLMRSRFHQDRIYVMGLSWGTILGTKLVQQYPDLFCAYVGTGQMVNTTENDRMGYEIAIRTAAENGDTGTVNKLRSYGPPPYTGDGMAVKYAAYNNILFDLMGSPSLEMVLLLAPQFAREYGLLDKVNFARGLVESFTVVYPQLQDLDFTAQANRLDLPVYFLVGRQDVNAMASLVDRYYNVLQAPHKELIWLESGHGATQEELLDAMVNHVLAQTKPAQ
ncbi:alpha/beta fold hydrolase [Pelotomaculum propionicicum]|uniref:alpha/beta fold hydrolase n=1 Tax=Pelotomaculum propionicicum TaxID=258475 RepID=UPI003B7ED473